MASNDPIYWDVPGLFNLPVAQSPGTGKRLSGSAPTFSRRQRVRV